MNELDISVEWSKRVEGLSRDMQDVEKLQCKNLTVKVKRS